MAYTTPKHWTVAEDIPAPRGGTGAGSGQPSEQYLYREQLRAAIERADLQLARQRWLNSCAREGVE